MSQSITHDQPRAVRMEMLKFIANIIGIPSIFLGIAWNLDNVKSTLIAILGILYLSVQLVFFIDRQMDVRRIRKINRWREEQKARGEGWK